MVHGGGGGVNVLIFTHEIRESLRFNHKVMKKSSIHLIKTYGINTKHIYIKYTGQNKLCHSLFPIKLIVVHVPQ